jgi:uncharacterized protein YecT (DUF1311 family)
MRNLLTLFFTLFIGVTINHAQNAKPYIDQSRNSCSDYLKSKKGLEDMVKNIQEEYAKYPLFLKKFQKAQDEWASYKDAQLEMLFPEADKAEYGAFYPTCRCNWLVEFTNQRVDFLVQFVSNTYDVESCGGAVNSKKRKSFMTFNE